MRSISHVVSGSIITAIISSFLSINIFKSINSLSLVIIFSLLPDIDHTQSFLGKFLKPVSSFLVRYFGHRTITHSLIFYIPLSIVISMFNQEAAIIIFIALLVHSLLDASTLNGVMLFYPLSKRIFVVPGNPDYRIKTGSRTEILMMVLFLFIGLALKPLYANGFWDTLRLQISPFEKITDNIIQSKHNRFIVDYSSNGIRQVLDVVSLAGDKKKLYCLDLESDKVVTIFDDTSLTTINKISKVTPAEVEITSSFTLDSIYNPHHQIIIRSDSPITLTYFTEEFSYEKNDYQFILWNSHVVDLVFTKLDRKEKELITSSRELKIINESISVNTSSLNSLERTKSEVLKKRSNDSTGSGLFKYDEQLSTLNKEIKSLNSDIGKLNTQKKNTELLIAQYKNELESLSPNTTVQSINYKLKN